MTTITRSGRVAAVLLAALAVLAIAAPPAAASAAAPPKPRGAHMHWYRWHPSGRALQAARFGSAVVVGLESPRDLAALRAAYHFADAQALPALHAVEVTLGPAELQTLLTHAPSDPRIRYVSPVRAKRQVTAMPNDPLLYAFDGQTNLPREWQFGVAHVDRALDLSQGRPDIVVGVVDSGIADVPDLAGKVDSLWTVLGTTVVRATEENDDLGHGTAVASLVAANVDDGFGMAGFGGATHVIGVHAGNQGYFTDDAVAVALTKLVSLGARIVNMSLGGRTPSEPILVDAIHLAAARGVLLVAASGNDNGYVGWPAADLQPAGGGRSYGLAVGATTLDGRKANFSDWGKHLSLVAPGDYGGMCSGVLVALPSATNFDDRCFVNWFGAGGAHYGYAAGTSFAAPEVAGVAALIWAARPELTNYEVADILKQSARRDPAAGWTEAIGCGVLDAGAALELATSGAAHGASGSTAVCSTAGDGPPTWPTEADQKITFAPLANKRLGDPDFSVHATASSGLPVSLTAVGSCTIRGTKVHLVDDGTCTITAMQEGDASHKLAPPVSRTFTIEPRRTARRR